MKGIHSPLVTALKPGLTLSTKPLMPEGCARLPLQSRARSSSGTVIHEQHSGLAADSVFLSFCEDLIFLNIGNLFLGSGAGTSLGMGFSSTESISLVFVSAMALNWFGCSKLRAMGTGGVFSLLE